jgi:hypothetical protein
MLSLDFFVKKIFEKKLIKTREILSMPNHKLPKNMYLGKDPFDNSVDKYVVHKPCRIDTCDKH